MTTDAGPAEPNALIARLREAGVLGEEQAARAGQAACHMPADRAAVEVGGADEAQVLSHTARLAGLQVLADLSDAAPSVEFAAVVPVDFARRHHLVGIEQEGRTLLVACSALEPEVADAVRHLLGADVPLALAPRAAVAAAVTRCYQHGARLHLPEADDIAPDRLTRLLDSPTGPQDLLAAGDDAPVVQLVNRVLFDALRSRASDVHLQPTAEGLAVRYRIDGVLHTVASYPARAVEPVVSRVKVMARLDVTERRIPQDGRTTVRLGNNDVDLRISVVPSNYGERVVVRLLDRSSGTYGLDELGMGPRLLAAVDDVVARNHGIFFCTGPTGSGKTTTLYAALSRVDARERNVITLEDPIEYHLDGITQLPVAQRRGMTFAGGLRSILRQDPDVIMVGEVRDEETATIAVQAAQTGHLVLSTLHTNDSAGAVARLLDLGVEPFLLSSTLTGVLAQRLVRRVCPHCGEPWEPPEADLARLPLARDAEQAFRRGRGCEKCLNTGYLGRVGLFELLDVDDDVRRLVLERADAVAIRQCGRRAGLVTLRADGAAKAAAGVTSVAEVLQATAGGDG